MAQPPAQIPVAAFSPPAASPPQGLPQSFAATAPPPKRPRLSPNPPLQPQLALQPQSPIATGSFATSPGAMASASTVASPTMTMIAGSPQPYSAPYQNGHATPGAYQQPLQPAAAAPYQPIASASPPAYGYSNASFTAVAPPTPGSVMGPPLKPADRPVREYQYDVDDSLAGTGIDLRQEEQFQADYFAGAIRPEARTGLPANTPGDRASFYGAGFANQPAQPAAVDDQAKFHLEAAKRAWGESAKALAMSRSQELRDPFLQTFAVHARAEKIAREYGIELNLEQRQSFGKMTREYNFPQPRVTVRTTVGPDGAMVLTTGSFIPEDAFLVDQLALLSISSKHRIRELMEDANRVAVTRQQTSHGKVPDEWLDAAAPLAVGGAAPSQEAPSHEAMSQDASPRVGDESAVSPRTNPLKRTWDAASEAATAEAKTTQIARSSTLTQSLRDVGRGERNSEESRLRKRQKRDGKTAAGGGATSRAASVAPGTPGSTAAEPEKAPTKKELKSKSAASKAPDVNNTTSANRTSAAFLGRKKKQYSWMAQPSSGASTPSRPGLVTQGLPGTPGASQGSGSVDGMNLTIEGRTRLGAFREDGDKGKKIQLRDWVAVLEEDGRESRVLQAAYDRLDAAKPPPPRQPEA